MTDEEIDAIAAIATWAERASERLGPALERRWYALMAEARRRGIPPEELLQLPWEELQDVGR